jgi:hypothetical protein
MDAYSGRPLAGKLGITAGDVVALVNAPEGFADTLGELADGVRLRWQARGPARIVILFARSRADLRRRFAAAVRAVAEGGSLWIAWPKKSSGLGTDLAQQQVRAFGLDAGWVDYKICSIDPTWSGLRFARRKA